jgi:SH3-like domain-containing protein
MPKIFVSYRRIDSEERAQRIADWLILKYNKENVFIDVDTIRGGADFASVINNGLAHADAILVIIGHKWLEEFEKRADNPEQDFVYREILYGLENIPMVIPVLLERGIPLHEDSLPPDLRPLLKRNFMVARKHPDFHRDMLDIKDVIDTETKKPLNWRPYSGAAIALITVLVTIFFVFSMLNNTDKGEATEIAQAQMAEESTPEISETPTETETATNTDEPSEMPTETEIPSETPTDTATVNRGATAAMLQTENANATATRQALEASSTAIMQAILDGEATQTQQAANAANTQESLDSEATTSAQKTQYAIVSQTGQIQGVTETAAAWTDTPTSTQRPSRTPMSISVILASLTIDVDSANLRSGPGTNYSAAGNAKRGEIFDIIAKYEDWYLIDLGDDDAAWIWSGITNLDGNEDEIDVAATVPPTAEISLSSPNAAGVYSGAYCTQVASCQGGTVHACWWNTQAFEPLCLVTTGVCSSSNSMECSSQCSNTVAGTDGNGFGFSCQNSKCQCFDYQ